MLYFLRTKRREIKIITFVLVYPEEGREKETLKKIQKLDPVNEAHICYFGKGELMIIAKLSTLNITEKELMGLVRKEIRSLDTVHSIGTMIVVPPESKPKPIDKELLELMSEDKGDWGHC